MSEEITFTTIGKSVVIEGELSGDENLVIEGRVNGNIKLERHVLTVAEHGNVNGNIVAKTVVVAGDVHGSIVANEKIDFRITCWVEADTRAPQVAIATGAYIRGSIDMRQPQGKKTAPASAADSDSGVLPAPRAKALRMPSSSRRLVSSA